jgi:hypothetical protein
MSRKGVESREESFDLRGAVGIYTGGGRRVGRKSSDGCGRKGALPAKHNRADTMPKWPRQTGAEFS